MVDEEEVRDPVRQDEDDEEGDEEDDPHPPPLRRRRRRRRISFRGGAAPVEWVGVVSAALARRKSALRFPATKT